jgi:hypothetical protein
MRGDLIKKREDCARVLPRLDLRLPQIAVSDDTITLRKNP